MATTYLVEKVAHCCRQGVGRMATELTYTQTLLCYMVAITTAKQEYMINWLPW